MKATAVLPTSDAEPALSSALAAASPEVKAFVASHAIGADVERAEEMVRRLFPNGTSVSLRIERDPEITDSWVDVRLTTAGDEQKLLGNLKAFSAEWVRRVSGAKRYLIRLSLDIA